MPFQNKIRLPFYLARPQYQVDEEIYRQSNGVRRVTKAIISKELNGKTDYMPGLIHERLVVALRHETVTITAEKINDGAPTNIRINGAYEIGWIEPLDHPVAPATFKAFDEGFTASNASCNTCDDTGQMELVDDQFPLQLQEGEHYEIGVAANDSICCVGPVFSILSFDASRIENVAITQLGILSFDVKVGITSSANAELVRYQVACGESLADAGVFGSVDGTVGPTCAIPTGLTGVAVESDPMPVAMHFDWDDGDAPAGGWNWRLMKLMNLAPPVEIGSGNVAISELDINALDPLKKYRLYVSAVCGELNESGEVVFTFTTPPIAEDPNYANIRIELVEVANDGFGNVTLAVRATILDGIQFQQNIDITGSVQVFTGGAWQMIPFDLRILGFESSGDSDPVAVVGETWSGSVMDDAVGDPTSANDSITSELYQILFVY